MADDISDTVSVVIALASAQQDIEVLLMRGDETRSYHTAEQRPWELQGYQMDEQPDLKVQRKRGCRERLPLEDV